MVVSHWPKYFLVIIEKHLVVIRNRLNCKGACIGVCGNFFFILRLWDKKKRCPVIVIVYGVVSKNVNTELKDIKNKLKAAATGMRKSISLGSRGGGVGEYQLRVNIYHRRTEKNLYSILSHVFICYCLLYYYFFVVVRSDTQIYVTWAIGRTVSVCFVMFCQKIYMRKNRSKEKSRA